MIDIEDLLEGARDAFDRGGHEAYLLWLDKERERVRAHLQAQHGIFPEPDSLGDILDEIIEVAGFYADPDKYRPIGKRPPEILGDKGERAQGLLETIDSLSSRGGGDDE